MKEQIANHQSESAAPLMEPAAPTLDLPDEFTFAEQVNKKYPKLKVKVTGQQVRKIWEFMGLS